MSDCKYFIVIVALYLIEDYRNAVTSVHKIIQLNNSSCKNYQLSRLSAPLKFHPHNFLPLLAIVIFSFYYFFGATVLDERITRSDLHRGYAQQQCMSTLRPMKAVVFSKRPEVVLAVFPVMAHSRFLIVAF